MGFHEEPPKSYAILDKPLHCQICNFDEFHHRKAVLKDGTNFFKWLFDTPAMCFVCARCGYVHWFLPR